MWTFILIELFLKRILLHVWISGEMWVGVTLAVVIEVVSVPLRTSAVAIYLFIISNVGGNMPLLVPVLKSAFENLGYSSTSSLRGNWSVVVLNHHHFQPSISLNKKWTTRTHTTVLLLFWNMSGTTRVSRYQKGKTRKVKTNLDLLEQEIVSRSGICWAICKSAPHPRQPCQYPTTQFFTGRMPFLPPNQQRQSTEGRKVKLAK